ncbi:MAG TPA: cyclopropane fatty acyl phospholipid synthase [Rhodanobacteraceae bacterium]|nr:cyclopropane fatty acyl phospholipid synthase [Rhodanobacteraceae bacterium]
MLSLTATQRTSANTDIQAVAAAGLALPDQAAVAIETGPAHAPAFAPARLALVARSRLESLLDAAGIRIDGCAPTDMRVRDSRVYSWLSARGLRGLGESYMNGWWDAADLDGLLQRVLQIHGDRDVRGIDEAALFMLSKLSGLSGSQPPSPIGTQDESPGPVLLRAILGERMVSSCGYWKDAYNLAGAQEAKFDLVCRKLGLAPGMHVLDIGCGWGEGLLFAAINYGVSGVGITFSQEQAEFARARCAGLPIEIRVQDYRLLDGRFDRCWSVGMFEHVGAKNHRACFQSMRRCLAPDGLMLLQSIVTNRSVNRLEPWMEKHVPSGSAIPTALQIDEAAVGLFVMEDWQNFGADYDRTFMAWRANFERSWPVLREKHDDRFQRMWRFYLSAAAATFRCRRNQLWQVVFSANGLAHAYGAVR